METDAYRTVGYTIDLMQAAAPRPVSRADSLALLLTVDRERRRREWDALRDRLPMLAEDAHMILESDSECRGEFGMGYVTGGGLAQDAGLAYAQFGQTDRQRELVAEADRTLRERNGLHVSDHDLRRAESILLGINAAVDPDDIPF